MNLILPPRQAYSFPILKADEISKCLSELGITITQEEITSPDKNRDSTRRILELLTEVCTGVSRDEMAQPAFVGLSVLNFPELHEDSIPQLNLFRACTKMMEICEIYDFTIKDFIFPTSNRFRRHLSGIINFAKFREERLVLLSNLSNTRAGLLDYLSQLRDQNESLSNRLEILSEQTSEESKTISTIENDCIEIETKIKACSVYQSELQSNATELKEANKQLNDKSIELTKKHDEALTLKKHLTTQIVSSPEKFRKQIIEVGQNLQAEQKDTKIAEKRIRELTSWIVNVEECNNEVNNALENLQELRVDADRQRNMNSELELQMQTTVANRVALSELEQNVQQLVRHTTRFEEKLTLLRSQTNVRKEETQKNLDHLHHQLIEAESFRLQVFIFFYFFFVYRL
jgi:kinetochore protein Nuf2